MTATPNEEHDTILHKKDFVDAIYIRYAWPIPDLPLQCVCGKNFDLQHSLDCLVGGFRGLQHNEVRDLVADCLTETHYRLVETENSSPFQVNHLNLDQQTKKMRLVVM